MQFFYNGKKHLPALTESFRFRLANGSVTWKFIRGIEILFCRRIESKAFQTYLLMSLRIHHDEVIHTLFSTYLMVILKEHYLSGWLITRIICSLYIIM